MATENEAGPRDELSFTALDRREHSTTATNRNCEGTEMNIPETKRNLKWLWQIRNSYFRYSKEGKGLKAARLIRKLKIKTREY